MARRALDRTETVTTPGYVPSPTCEEFIWAVREGPAAELRVLILVGPRGEGKCVTKRATILDGRGALTQIDGHQGGDVLAFDTSRLEIVAAPTGAAESFGIQPCLRLRTQSGYVVEGNAEHPFLTIEGWRALGDVVVGTHIATLRECSAEGRVPLPTWMPEFAGLMVGDGACSPTSAVAVCASDQKFGGLLSEMAVTLGWGMRWVPRRDGTSSGATRLLAGSCDPSPRSWLRALGLDGTTAHTKVVPAAIFTAPNDQVARFVGAYFACDGTVPKHRAQAEFSSVSRALLAGVKHLLLRFGVVSTLRGKAGRYRGARHESWRLVVNEPFLTRFAEAIPIPGEKGGRIRAAQRVEGGRRNTNLDVIPKAWARLTSRSASWHAAHGAPYASGNRHGHGRDVVLRVARSEGNVALEALATAPIFWDRVVAIDDVGHHEVFNVEVPGPHTFIADGGVITHNTTTAAVAILALAERVQVEAPMRLPIRVAVIRDSWVNLERTTVQSLRDLGRKGADIVWKDQGRQAVITSSGTQVAHLHFFGLDRAEDADKLQGFEASVLWLEEVAPAAGFEAGIPAEAFGLGVTSLRQRGVPKRVLVSMNPPDEDAWILHVEDLLDDLDLGSVRVKRWTIPPGEKERHFRALAARAKDAGEGEAWTHAADEFKAYREWCEAALVAIGRKDLATRLVGGQIAEVQVGAPVVSTFQRLIHVVPALQPISAWPIVRGHDGGGSPSTVICQPLGAHGLDGLNILASHTSLNAPLEQHVQEWVIPTMARLGLMAPAGRTGAERYAQEWNAVRRHRFTYRDIGDPSMAWEGGTVKAENTSGRVIQEMLGAVLEPGPVDWDSRREALLASFRWPGRDERSRFIQIDRRENVVLIQALAGRFRYPKDMASGRFTQTIEAAKRASGPKFSGVPDALAYVLAVLYPAAEMIRQTMRRPVPAPSRGRSWLSA